MLFLPLALMACSISVVPFIQDPFVAAPQAYKREFENDWVRVVRVRYGPREKIASHDHPRRGTVYIYLRNSGPVRFTHTGEEKFTLIRPAVKGGGFRLGRRLKVKETHEVESLSEHSTEFLRVELKTLELDTQTFRGRFPPEPHPTDNSSQKVRFENRQVRILHVTCAARHKCEGTNPSTSPSLLVALTPSHFRRIVRDGTASDLKIELGQTFWLEANDQLHLENTGNVPAELLKIELRTKPANNPEEGE
ncbi:MAG: hypothetical protein H0T92_12025 [Pyrinomonadaceae bacterium]|nr:hypothetical protein [Pyrinomonadaceae bacterium]